MIYIVKTSDNRYFYLNEFLSLNNKCEYSFNMPTNSVDKIVLPLEGIDEFGYIKGSGFKLENILQNNKVTEIYTGKTNKVLNILSQKYNFKLFSFYDDFLYCKNEFLLKLEVIKIFLQEKLNVCFDEIKLLILGCNYQAYLASSGLEKDIYDKENLSKYLVKDIIRTDYDVLVNFSDYEIGYDQNKIVIEMRDIKDLDTKILLSSKNIYFINHLTNQYLTKSGGRLLYDSMVRR